MAYCDWREDPGMQSYTSYKKKFATFPVVTIDGQKIWWESYYIFYRHWVNSYGGEINHDKQNHRDRIGNISEAEYLVRKLSESL